MSIIADLHVHIYPSYDYELVFNNIFNRFEKLAKLKGVEHDYTGIIALTERSDCNFYDDFYKEKISLSNVFKVTRLAGCISIVFQNRNLFVFPGRQLNTIEKIELLSLGSDERIIERQSLVETLSAIKLASAIPVINWAPGKWWFARGKLISNLIENSNGSFILCDTSLRPTCYPLPLLMRKAFRKGIKIIYGSDPLPDSGEIENVARYVTFYSEKFDGQNPSEYFRNLLLTKQGIALGERSSLLELFFRMKKYYS